MALSNVELYEALKEPVGAEAARMIAEVVPPAGDIATKQDLALLKSDFSDLRADFGDLRADFGGLRGEFAELKGDFAELRADLAELRGEFAERMAALEVRLTGQISDVNSQLMGRMWVMFVPMWVGTFGIILTLLLRGG